MNPALLTVEDVEVVYDAAILAVRGVSLTVGAGEIVALLGANGAGKSSLLRAVSNILHAQRGRISGGRIVFDGTPTARLPTSKLVAAGLVQVLEGRHCFLSLTVEENLLAGAIGRGSTRAQTRADLGRVFALFPGIAEKRRLAAGLLSGGQQQMVAIGRAMMARPRLLLLDEPSMGLAPIVVAEIFAALTKLNRDEGLAILLAEQNAGVALRHAHRAVVLENGRLVSSGTAAELRNHNDIRAAYLGTPPPRTRLRRLKERAMTVIQKSEPQNQTAQSHPDPKGAPVPGLPRPATPAHIVSSDAEAIAIATALAAEFKENAAARDRERIWPVAELDAFSQSGLWSINVPKAYGGPGLSYVTMNKVIEIISEADSSLGQIPQNHLGVVAAINTVSDEVQKELLFAEVLRGTRFGNAFSEFGSKRAADFETKFIDAGDNVIVNGKKFYSTGALLAHLVPIVALDDQGRAWYAIADRNAPGLSVIDDWSAMGQRTTLSGTVTLDNVVVPKTHLVPGYKGYEVPTADGPIFQIIQAAVDTGIAAAAIADTIAFVRGSSRAWVDSGVDHAWQDPYTIQAVGDLQVKLLATRALLDQAGLAVDAAVAAPDADSVAKAQIAVAAAKIFSTELSIAATNKLFELAGTRATLAVHGLDRHWRNARTHTLHDPVRWKYAILGNYYLNGVNPPLHAWS